MKKAKNKKGVTLLELVVTIAISSIIIVAVVAVFASFVKNRRAVRSMQQDMENTRSALELMGKSIRMSCNLWVIDSATKEGTGTIIFLADQTANDCYSYKFLGGKIIRETYQGGAATEDLCDTSFCKFALGATAGSAVELTDSKITGGGFVVDNNNNENEIPRVTINVQTADKIMQTTVSARNYYYLEPR